MQGPGPHAQVGYSSVHNLVKGVYRTIQDGGLHIFISNISRNNSKLMYIDSQCWDYKTTANWATPHASLSYFLLHAHYSSAAWSVWWSAHCSIAAAQTYRYVTYQTPSTIQTNSTLSHYDTRGGAQGRTRLWMDMPFTRCCMTQSQILLTCMCSTCCVPLWLSENLKKPINAAHGQWIGLQVSAGCMQFCGMHIHGGIGFGVATWSGQAAHCGRSHWVLNITTI